VRMFLNITKIARTRTTPHARVAIIAFLLAGSLTGCSSFQADWDKAAAQVDIEKSHPVLGRWEGIWQSKDSNHKGDLRCIITKLTPEETNEINRKLESAASTIPKYRFYFEGVWGWDFHSTYTVVLAVTPTKQGQKLTGEHDLGWPIGIYKSQGMFEGSQLKATYEAAGDHGVFEMKRPSPDK
jgi:hypothetical protein